MKKFLLFIAAIFSVALSANADEKQVTFDFQANPWGLSLGSGTGTTAEAGNVTAPIEQDGVSLSFLNTSDAKGTPVRMWNVSNKGQLRVYTGDTMVINQVGTDLNIVSIAFTKGSKWANPVVNGDTLKALTWTGSAKEITFISTGNTQINSMVITLSDNDTPVVPTPDPTPDPVVDPTPTAGTGNGTIDNPFDAAAANSVASALTAGNKTQNDYYIKGKVSEIKSQYGTTYGNGSFCISTDGTQEGQFLVWRALYLKNAKYAAGQDTIKLGDEVVVYGKLMNYLNSKDNSTTAETAQGEAYLYSLNGKTESEVTEPEAPAAEGDGTIDNPYNTTGVLEYINTLESGKESAEKVYIKGKVCSIRENFGTQYGNATFSISADGKEANSFLIYRAFYLNNLKYADDADAKLNIGDDVIICGQVINYNGNTPETVAGQAFIYSLNGTVSGINNAAINAANAKQSIYTLDGRKASVATKGVYIINGKKVIK